MMEFFCPRGNIRALRAGESVASVAAEAGVTPGRLMEMNPYLDPENIREGQLICVPGAGNWARVRYGDAWEDLLARHRAAEEAMAALNPHLDKFALLPGQRYRVPG